MSELEILQRQNYKRNRKKWSMIQLIAIIIAAAIALVSFFMYHRIDRTQLIEYMESGDVDYREKCDRAFCIAPLSRIMRAARLEGIGYITKTHNEGNPLRFLIFYDPLINLLHILGAVCSILNIKSLSITDYCE